MLTYNKRNKYLFSWGVPKINKKRFFICILLAFLFISTDVFSVGLTNILGTSFNYNIVYAKSSGGGHSSGSSRSSGGSFKSGSFSSPKSSSGTTKSQSSSTTNKSSTSDFKSGSFSNTPKSSTVNNNSQTNSNTSTKNYDSGTKRSFLPIPIPWGHSSYYGPSFGYGSNSFVGSSILWLLKLIFIIIIIVVIVKLIKRYKRK